MLRLKKALDVKKRSGSRIAYAFITSETLIWDLGLYTRTFLLQYVKICHAQCDKPKVQSINKEMVGTVAKTAI
jgi:hypothetical protein